MKERRLLAIIARAYRARRDENPRRPMTVQPCEDAREITPKRACQPKASPEMTVCVVA